jgi:integrase/recombinase XerD
LKSRFSNRRVTLEQARTLIRSVDTRHVMGLRDRAILATLAYTVCRAGAVAKLRLGDLQQDGTQYVLRFQEKGGKSPDIPVRHDLEGHIRMYLDSAGIGDENRDRPLFRSTAGKTKRLTDRPLMTKDVCRMTCSSWPGAAARGRPSFTTGGRRRSPETSPSGFRSEQYSHRR